MASQVDDVPNVAKRRRPTEVREGLSTDHFTHICALILAAIPTFAGTKRGLIVPGLRLSEVLILVLLVLLAFRLHRKFWLGGTVFWPLTFYASSMAAIVAYHSFSKRDLGAAGFLDYGVGPTTFLLIYIAATASSSLVNIQVLVCRYLFSIAGVMGLVGMLQTVKFRPALDLGVFMTGNTFIGVPLEWKVPRSAGIFNSWHAYASYSALVLILIVSCMISGAHIYSRNWALPLCSVFVAGGLLSTLTFGMVGLAGIACLVLCFKFGRIRYILYGLIFSAVLFYVTPLSNSVERRVHLQEVTYNDYGFLPQTAAFRLAVWSRDFLPLIADNPVFGYGPVTSVDRTFSYVESMYILVLLLGGVVGLAAFACVLVATLMSLRSSLRLSNVTELAALSRGTLYFVVGLVPLLLIHPYLNDAGSSQLAFVMVGLLCVRSYGAGSQRVCDESPPVRRIPE